MTKENINHIGPFRQFNKSSYEQNGNGLGLYIIKKIIEMNNGKFIITSELEKGTCIEIILFGVKL